MYNTLIIRIVMNAVPSLALVFVVVLAAHKVYTKIRARYNIKVNCWFCNENTKVAYAERNSWNCPHCEQYNGFNKDGDYNREIYQQLDCSNLSFSSRNSDEMPQIPTSNGFCNTCNEAQRLKVEKLAQFEPKNEARFDAELKAYKTQLEAHFGLCGTCDRHLKKVLREKKKMVLGSKFMQYVLQGAHMLKQPNLRQQQRVIWKQRFQLLTNFLAFINICCLILSLSLPDLSLQHLTAIFGDFLGYWLFDLASHIIAFLRVLRSYIESATEVELMLKLRLFCRTIFLMLLYSLGLKLPQLMRVNFKALFLPFSPYALLLSAIAYNLLDNWRSARHISLVALWSVLAANFIALPQLTLDLILLAASLITLIVNLKSLEEHSLDTGSQNISQSFHRLYSEDYLTDEDTLSLLSEQLSSSAASQSSVPRKSPLTFAANNHTINNIGFRYASSLHSPYAASVCSLGAQQASNTPLYASNMDLHARNSFNPYLPTGPVETHADKPMQKKRFNGSLLSPSRFINTPHYYPVNANLMETQPHYNVASMLHEARGMNNISRCSSHSSGFESQPNERGLCGGETGMSGMNPAYLDQDCRTAFDPVLPHAARPCSVNYMPTGRDRFNFQQFDAQLPRYRRGDLLRKFKQTQSIM